MATSTPPASKASAGPDDSQGSPDLQSPEKIIRLILMRMASLKITVTTLSMAIILVVVGTLAQVDKDIWQVVDEYFRSPLAWIDFKVFFPPSFFPGLVIPNQLTLPGGFILPLGVYFPGGWLIGGLMTINLFAALLVRFPVQATGFQRKLGWIILGVGFVLTWLVVVGGGAPDGEESVNLVSRDTLWKLIQLGLGLICLGLAVASARLGAGRGFQRAALLCLLAVFGAVLIWMVLGKDSARLGDSSLRILWQMFKGQLATVVLLIGCSLLYKKKAGLVLLHGGIGLMMFGEVLTGLTAIEGQIQMMEGEASNFVRNTRSLELAVIDHSDPERDVVVSVPESRLLSNETIRNETLPFDIRLVDYYKNSVVKQAKPGETNLATAGIGLSWVAEPSRTASGTDGGRVNMSAAYLAFLDKKDGKELGTHVVGLAFTEGGIAEKVEVNGKPYEVSLRQKRSYKPYTLKLIDVQKEDYPGTDIPKHYASTVHVIDESRHVDRNVKIWMNNPLRFAGETFYQSGYYRDPQTGAEASTLSVVTNTGWMIPYVSCMIVATGLLAQFSIVLSRFLKRRSEMGAAEVKARPRKTSTDPDTAPSGKLGFASKLILPLVVVVSAGWIVSRAVVPSVSTGGFHLDEFGKLPVLDHGRAKPVDSLARTSLQIISGRQSFVDTKGDRQPAIRWFLDLITQPGIAADYKVFRIEHPEVLSTLGLTSREGLRYAFHEFSGHLDDLKQQVELALTLEPSNLSVYQKKILELDRKLSLWNLLIQAYIPPADLLKKGDWAAGLGRSGAGEPVPLCIPVGTNKGGWQTYVRALGRNPVGDKAPATETLSARATRTMGGILQAYAKGDSDTFNRGTALFEEILVADPQAELNLKKIHYEAFFNHFEPAYHATLLYAGAFILAAIGWLGWGRQMNRASFGLLLTAFGLHLFVLISRIYISGRPPVTNLYSSAIFIGWAAVFFGLGLELVYRLGIGNVIASVIGFASLLVAHFLGGDGDTFAVLQAVLDTQFWLATHVVCITLGYSATYVAGLLGLIYIVRGVLTQSLKPTTRYELNRMIYGTTCFAILFSFVGTVLGGLWADDSWGRFWGWDPKENGALIIVLWNAMVLHAKRGGLIKQRGLAVLAVAGNIAVSWSWFGVNELGIGLHSYGFTEGALKALGIFVASQLAIVALGLLPESVWRSRTTASVVEPA